MAEFSYVAFAADGSHSSVHDEVTAANKAEAEKKIRAKYSYPVNIRWDDEDELDSDPLDFARR